MVEILCPHCEGEIELDDDASGEFECPLCGGEFEWNMDGDESYESGDYSDDLIITTDFREMPAVPKVAGIAFCVWMVIVIAMGLMAMIGGLMLNSAESSLGTGTSFGADANKGYFVDTTSSSVTVNLPAGSVGDEIHFTDYAGNFDTNEIIFNANGTEKILGIN